MPFPKEKTYTEEDYYNIPENVRAELIDGQIYYQAAPSRIHQEILSNLHAVIYNYIKSKGEKCRVYPSPFAVKLRKKKKDIVEPDISVICDREKLTDKGCEGAPDWIIEIVSPGNSSHDYIRKLNLYNCAGVREYWIINPDNQEILVYLLNEKQFDIKHYTFEDSIPVGIFEDFCIRLADFDIE